jgi:hypothetical protein
MMDAATTPTPEEGTMPKKDFTTWLAEVDAALEVAVGLSTGDLVDQPYYDWYEGGTSPAAAARRALKRALADA